MSYSVSSNSGAEISLNETDYVKSVLQNVSIILRTRQGTVPLYRDFGLPMRFIDKPMNIATPTMLIEAREAINRFEPRAELVNIKAAYDESGKLILEAEVNIADEES